MAGYPRPNAENMRGAGSVSAFITTQQNIDRPRRTTASFSGTPQQQVTAQSLSDVLQGTMSVRGPEDQMVVINRALSGYLDGLYSEGFAKGSRFSEEEADPYRPGSTDDPDVAGGGTDGGTGGGGAAGGAIPAPGSPRGSWSGNMNPESGIAAAHVLAEAGFYGEDLINAVAVAGRESGWVPEAKNPNTSDRGLLQINGEAWRDTLKANGMAPDFENDMMNPVIGAAVAFWIYTNQGNKFDIAWSISPVAGKGWTHPSEGGAWRNFAKFAEARIAVKAAGYGDDGKGIGMRSVGNGNVDWGTATGGTNTIEEILYAGSLIANHPNNWMVTSDNDIYEGALRKLLVEGAPPNSDLAVITANGRAFLYPSLLNYLYYILENGFILDGYLGAIGKKRAGQSKTRWSNHSYGGAIDIGLIGLASENRVYQIGSSESKRVGDQLFNLLATLPKERWADEHGYGSWSQYYGANRLKIYPDAGHMHLGFGVGKHGSLIPSLKRGNSSAPRTNPNGPV